LAEQSGKRKLAPPLAGGWTVRRAGELPLAGFHARPETLAHPAFGPPSAFDVAAARTPGAYPVPQLSLPLAGVTVIDLSRVLAGPYCTLLLADMGAEVIKIENPDGGDDTRAFTEPNLKGVSTYFLTINRNRRSVALDLKSAAGREACLKLVANADVVVENFRTGVMERLGLGYDVMKERRPSLVYCAISGYGRSGANVDVPGYDPVAQAESGLMSMIGEPDGQPTRVGPSIIDLVAGIYAAQAVSAALRHTALTGVGRFIEVTLHETGLNMLANFAGAHLIAGQNPTRTGSANQVAQPINVYDAADGPFMMTVANQAQFVKLCRDVLQRPEWLEPERFAQNSARLAKVDELTRLLNGIFVTRPREEWVARLRQAGVPAGVVASVAEALGTALVRDRETVREVRHREAGAYRVLRTPARLHGSEPLPPVGAPELGEHTREVLGSIAGMSESDIDALIAAGAAK
jgi:crotonobetainyl-CoA:carnitine CoA-transferase CaiB-like acyl-CoA transferase